MKFIIKTLSNLENILAKEVEELGAKSIKKITRGVSCEADMKFMYQANLHLRTALKVLIPFREFDAKSTDEIYEQVYTYNWEDIFSISQTFLIDAVVNSQYFNHSRYLGLRVKDAIADKFRNKYDRRPYVDTENPDVRIQVHVQEEHVTLLLDTSGLPLNQRGYRSESVHLAPINEVLAAGLLKLANWNKDLPLIDPMCGSGTLLVEALMIANGMAPNIYRDYFAFKTWQDFNPVLWNRVKSDAMTQIRKSSVDLCGMDNDKEAISWTKKSLKKMGLGQKSKLIVQDCTSFQNHLEKGMIITNPPYGDRIGEDVERFYEVLGNLFKKEFKNFDVWLISANKEALKKIGLKPEKKIQVMNGPLICDFCHYPMY